VRIRCRWNMFTETLPRNGQCLQSYRLATGLYATICNLSRRKNMGFETQRYEIPGKPLPEVWIASHCATFKGECTWLIIKQNSELGRNTC
jgi:hypothetical protein